MGSRRIGPGIPFQKVTPSDLGRQDGCRNHQIELIASASPTPFPAAPLPSSSSGAPGPSSSASAAGAAPSAGSASLAGYVHFPYCLEKCPYCDFVSYKRERSAIDHEAYADAVLAELAARTPSFAGRTLRSVFFGGGTPSLWRAESLGSVLSALKAAFGGDAEGELEATVECNPTSLDRDHANALAAAGVNRLSIG
ncbi:MAG: radical SAM protein, partial [Proteobacteria bacterium]